MNDIAAVPLQGGRADPCHGSERRRTTAAAQTRHEVRRCPARRYPLPLGFGASTLDVIELIHELITLDQELMMLDVGKPLVEVGVPVVVAVVVTVVVVVVRGVVVLFPQAVPMPPIAMTARIPAVAAN